MRIAGRQAGHRRLIFKIGYWRNFARKARKKTGFAGLRYRSIPRALFSGTLRAHASWFNL
jgi:hypothetical protein